LVDALIRSMRPGQWTKNGVVFAGVIFAMRLGDAHAVWTVVAACAIFCMLSSALYIVNDLFDAESDRLHAWKRSRPIASGLLPEWIAWVAALILGVGGLLLGALLGRAFFHTLLGYACLMGAYSIGLKRIAMLDVLIIAIGFVLRAAAGAVVIDVLISPWLLVCTLLLALLLALAKRRQEAVAAEGEGAGARAGWGVYSTGLMDQMIAAIAAATVVCYSLYTLAPETLRKFGTTTLIYTIPCVIYGVFRYVYLVRDRDLGERPERVLYTDVPLIVSVILWGAIAIAALYGLLPEPPIENVVMGPI
jgi:4-hydroxybenzoate polyprenyltransferase